MAERFGWLQGYLLPKFPVMPADVTRLLNAIEQGDPAAANELLPLVYDELRRLAAVKLSREQPGQTLQATALVHDAWIRLTGDEPQQWDGRRHFFFAAAEAMRRILVDKARRRQRVRHGAGLQRVDIDEVEIADSAQENQLLDVDEALAKLEREHPSKAAIVKLRYFVGMTAPETAEALGLSVATVERHWSFAKAWLFKEFQQARLAVKAGPATQKQ